MPIIDPVKECRAAAEKFDRLAKRAESKDVRELAAGLVHLTAAIRAIADPEGAKLAMDWPW
ncbi:hypothetical protein MHPYR_90004 [uncultured Mycobacterium sp.]|uniref:Uncharacterized protein n=1 Tax=uncultured Mycobacterium sp. TaxID=171292 RepID=A0A1Y5PLX8_9MYCO|nr:hypothetical protein MHPYR_90004 [uncultured Mycobacterium sp.]